MAFCLAVSCESQNYDPLLIYEHVQLYQAFLASGLKVEVEPRGQWSAAQADEEDTSRSRRGDLKVIGGAGLGSSAVNDVSIASVFSLYSRPYTRHEDEIVRYSPVFTNFHPIVMTHTGTCHPSVKAIFDSLSACGVDVVALKRSIAFGLLRSRAHAYRAIYDAVKIPRSGVDYSLSLPPRSSVRAACVRTQVKSPLALLLWRTCSCGSGGHIHRLMPL